MPEVTQHYWRLKRDDGGDGVSTTVVLRNERVWVIHGGVFGFVTEVGDSVVAVLWRKVVVIVDLKVWI